MHSRRDVLRLAVVTCASAACSSPSGVSPDDVGDVPAGAASSLAVGALRGVQGEPVCVGRDGGGVYAMTLTCTHAGCRASVSGVEIDCPCHGSRFDRNGGVIGGPAPSPLQHFAVSADMQGNLTVHTGQNVDASTRLKV